MHSKWSLLYKVVVAKVFDNLGLCSINTGNEAWDDYRISKVYMSCGVAKKTLCRKNEN